MSFSDEWAAIKAELNALVLRIAKWSSSADDHAAKLSALEAAIHGREAPEPAPPKPPPDPLPASASEWVECIATYWTGVKDGDNDRLLFALPAGTFPDERMDVELMGRRAANLKRGDTGPWSTRDPFFRTPGRRPLAETFLGQAVRWDDRAGAWTPAGDGPKVLTCNGAGLDLTRAVWAQLLGVQPADVDRLQPTERVRFRLRRTVENFPAHPDIAAAADALVGHPFPYDPGTEDGNLGCADVVSTALIRAGALAGTPILSVDALDARLRKDGWAEVGAPWQPGDVIVWAATQESNGHKHVGVAVSATEVVENSSRKRAVERIKFADYTRPILRGLRKGA